MKLDTDEIAILQSTRPLFAMQGSAVAQEFYANLFRIAPDLRALFPDDLSDQGRKLATTIAVTVDAIGDWDRMAPILATLARRHLGYGVEPWHYAIVVQALMVTLEASGVGKPALAIWRRAMSIITGYMIEVACPRADGARELVGSAG